MGLFADWNEEQTIGAGFSVAAAVASVNKLAKALSAMSTYDYRHD